MKVGILLFAICISITSIAAERDPSVEALIRSIQANPVYNFHFSPEEHRILLGLDLSNPNNPPLVPLSINGEDTTDVIIAAYLGTAPGADGKREHIFDIRERISQKEFDTRKAKGSLAPPGNKGSSESANPSDAPSSTNQPAAPKGSFFDNLPAGLKEGIGNVGSAAAGAAITQGIVRGLIVTPGDQRELGRLQQEASEAAARTVEQQNLLFKELAEYDVKIGDFVQKFQAQMKDYKPLPLPEATSPKAKEFLNSEIGKVVQQAREKLDNFNPRTPVEEGLSDISRNAAEAAESSYYEGAEAEAKELADLSLKFADVAVGLDPFTGLVRDGYEFLTGVNGITNEKLTAFERTLSGVGFVAGIASAGAGSSIVRGMRLAGKMVAGKGKLLVPVLEEISQLSAYMRGLGIQSVAGWKDFVNFSRRTLGNEIGAVGNVRNYIDAYDIRKLHLGKWANQYNIHRVRSADDLNAAFKALNPRFRAPYKAGTMAFDMSLKSDAVFLRLHNGANKQGRWLVRGEAIDKSLTPAELRIKYSLPVTPEYVSEVFVEKGTMLRRSKVAENFGGGESAVQYEILETNWEKLIGSKIRFSDVDTSLN